MKIILTCHHGIDKTRVFGYINLDPEIPNFMM